MAEKNIPKDRILPLEKLLLGAMVGELNGYASQADRYSKIVPAILPGMPDFVHLLRQLVKRLIEEILERIRDRLTDLIALAMTYIAAKVIPIINEIIYYVNELIRFLNKSFKEIMKVLRPIFQVLMLSGLIFGICKILLSVIPDAGFGMGAVFIPTTAPKRSMKFICDLAESTYNYMKKICGYILSACNKIIQYCPVW